jgi:hypothetical protein
MITTYIACAFIFAALTCIATRIFPTNKAGGPTGLEYFIVLFFLICTLISGAATLAALIARTA